MSATYEILEGDGGVDLRGGALELWKYRGPEVIISGPADTGKTFAALFKLDALLWKYPGAQAIAARRIRDNIHSTFLPTYVKEILGPDTPVRAYGGERPVWFDYPNGSRLWLAGLDDPGKALSAQRDFIYVNQAEELTLDDWQVLTTRASGRAGNAPYGQTFGDCNPGAPHHWIKNRASLKLLESRHEDNPAIWDAEKKEWTPEGVRRMAVLDALTGVRRERLRLGRWVSAEGAVYDFEPTLHLIDKFPIPADWTRIRAFDFGLNNPFVCLWLAMDGDGRLFLYREIYMTGRTVREHAPQVVKLSTGESYAASVSDHAREERASLEACGIFTQPADKRLTAGIQAVQARLQVAADGKPRLFIMRGALVERDESLAQRRLPVCTEQEFGVYLWPKSADGRPIKEVPVDLYNHGMDALRYGCVWADLRQRAGSATPSSGKRPVRMRDLAASGGSGRAGRPSFRDL